MGRLSARDDIAAGLRIRQAGELRSVRIESVRAVAALAVLFGHTWAASQTFGPRIWDSYPHRVLLGGGLGVYLFFVLSGYLLFWPFARAHVAGGAPVALGRYARNRALRILPLYFTVVAVLYVLEPAGARGSDWWRFALFIENFSHRTAARLDSPMWSLVVEMQFYILLPFLAAGIGRLARGSVRRALGVVAALAAASFALRLATVLLASPPDQISPLTGRYSLPTLFFYFCAGMALALIRLARREDARPWRGVAGSTDAWLAAAVVAWLIACVKFKYEPVTALAGALVVGACVLPLRPGPFVRVLEWRPLAAVGLASYSLYLWHGPLVLWMEGGHYEGAALRFTGPGWSFAGLLAVAAPVSIAVALVSYRLIESPFLRLRRRWSPAAAPEEPPDPAALPAAADAALYAAKRAGKNQTATASAM